MAPEIRKLAELGDDNKLRADQVPDGLATTDDVGGAVAGLVDAAGAAAAAPVQSVNGATGAVALDAAAVGADPAGAATAAQAAAVQRANHTGTQAISTVSGLQGALDAKIAKPTGPVEGDILRFDGTGWVADSGSYVASDDVRHVVVLTDAEYEALPAEEPNTLYITTG